MHLAPICRNTALIIVLGNLYSAPLSAVTIEFNAILTNNTCSLSLDKSTLPLGQVTARQLLADTLLASQPFTLFVRGCNPNAQPVPALRIEGNGVIQDNKWLFRNSNSASNVGIVVIQSDTLPNYAQTEIRDGTEILLGDNGNVTSDLELNFYAGVSCGGTTGCASRGTGDVTANLMFTFAYE